MAGSDRSKPYSARYIDQAVVQSPEQIRPEPARKMTPSVSLVLLLTAALLNLASAGGGHHGGHSHVVIHVPYNIKTIKHTHTITKHIHHGGGGGGGDKYEVLGYTVGHPIDLGGHGGGGHDIGGSFGGGFGGGHGGGFETSGGGGGDFGGGHEGFGGH